MGVIEIEDKSILEPLFTGWEETLIWSCPVYEITGF